MLAGFGSLAEAAVAAPQVLALPASERARLAEALRAIAATHSDALAVVVGPMLDAIAARQTTDTPTQDPAPWMMYQ